MLVNLFVNMGIMLVAIYYYFSFNNSTTRYLEKNRRHYLLYTAFVSGVGLLQMMFSVVVVGIRFDFRVLLFALVFKYLDLKTAISSLVILTAARFLWGSNDVVMLNMYNSMYLLVTMPLLIYLMKDRLSNEKQLLILLANTTLTTTVASIIIMQDRLVLTYSLVMFWAINYLMLFFCKLIIKDLSHVVEMINNDCLTNLNNQRRFQEDIAILDTLDDSVSIALIDLDHFKYYNDTYGHKVGDVVLQKFSAILQEFVSNNTNAYRVGGEEFVLIMTNKTPQEAESVVKQLHQKVQAVSSLKIGQDTILHPTISIGLAHRDLAEKALETYRRSDQAVYFCKNNGRNQVKIAKSPLNLLAHEEETAEESIQERLDQVGQVLTSRLVPQTAKVTEHHDN